MRNKLLGTIAAVAAGAGVAPAESRPATPPPPMPIGPAGMPTSAGAPPAMSQGMGGMGPMAGPQGMGGMVMPANNTVPVGPPVASPMAGYGAPGSALPGLNGLGMPPADMTGGAPGYPPGLHGQQQYQVPAGSDGLFGAAPAGVNSRLAARTWFSLDYLLWFGKSQPSNFPLLTSGAPAGGGVPGTPGTQTLVGLDNIGYKRFNGFRAEVGYYLDPASRYGVYLGGFLMEQRTNITEASSDITGQPLIARPFVNAATGNVDAQLVSFPNFAAGDATVSTSSFLWGAEGGSWTNLYRACPEEGTVGNLNVIAGFRYLELYENLRFQQQSTILPGSTAFFDGKVYGGPALIGVFDDFETHNRFYGGQVGLNGDIRRGRYFLSGSAKVALGVMNERLDVRGTSAIVANDTAVLGLSTNSTVPGGLFANSNTIGRFIRDEFAVVPEFSINLGYSVTSWLTATIGYNYLFVSRVARPGDQVNFTVDPATIPTSGSFGVGGVGPIGPRAIDQSTYNIQGVNFGIVVRY